MLPYYKKYTIITVIIAVIPSLVVSTVYPLFTGQIMAASLGGLITLFILFFGSLYLGFMIMERRAEQETEKLLTIYNANCDPERFVKEGADLAAAIQFPCKEAGAWYLGYYGQALLDTGDIARAQEIAHGLELSISQAKKSSEKAGILVNLLPLIEKLSGDAKAEELIQQGLQLLAGDPSGAASVRRDFLNGQKKLIDARSATDPQASIQIYDAVTQGNRYPMRVRVESAWNEANAYYKAGDLRKERECLEFVVANGNKLALVAQARSRLKALSVQGSN